MRFKLTILLIILNGALFGYLLYLNKAGSTQDRLQDEARLILAPDFSSRIDRFTVESSALESVWELRKQGEDWEVLQPLRWPANSYAVEQLLFQLKRLRRESRFSVASLADTGRGLADYGLETPALTLRLGSGDRERILRLGDPTEIGARLYILSHDGETVQVVPRDLLDALRRDPESFYDPRVFSLSFEETNALQIQDRITGTVRIRLVRSEDGWEFVSPMETQADDERVRSLLDQWQSLQTGELLSPQEAPVGFAGNSLRLTLEGLSRRETLVISSTGEENARFYASREAYPAAFEISGALVSQLRRAQENLREKRFLHTLRDQWNSLEVRMNDRTLTLQQLESGEWQVLYTTEEGNLQTLPAEEDVLSELKSLIGRMEAVRFVTDAPSESDLQRFGLEDPQRRILFRRPEKEDVALLVGGIHPEETLLYATTSTSGSVFLVRPQILASFPLDPLHYRDRSFWRPSPGQSVGNVELIRTVAGIDLLHEAGEQETLRNQLYGWAENLVVERYLSVPFTDPLRLDGERRIPWEFRFEVTMSADNESGDAEARVFLLSEPMGGGMQYIGDPESGEVGIVPPEMVRALTPLMAKFPKEPPPAPDNGAGEEPEPDS